MKLTIIFNGRRRNEISKIVKMLTKNNYAITVTVTVKDGRKLSRIIGTIRKKYPNVKIKIVKQYEL